MRRRFLIISMIFLLFGCDKENAWDCIQTAGPTIEFEVETPFFERVIVNRDIQLFISQADNHSVRVETGENLVGDIEIKVTGDQLQLSDKNSCNFVRDYGLTKVYITTPDLSEIRNSSQYEVRSLQTLNFENLVLNSEDFNDPDSFNVGDFRLSLNCSRIQVVSNNISSFYLNGTVDQLSIGFFSGDGRFEGAGLEAQRVQVFHRGSNDMIVNPVQSLSGELRSTGNLISINLPPLVDVQEFYTGQLIFQD